MTTADEFMAAMIIIIILFVIWIIAITFNMMKMAHCDSKMENLHHKIDNLDNFINYHKDIIISTESAEKLLNFIRMISSQIAMIQFRNFIDSHDISKVTKANIRDLVEDTATNIKNSLNIDDIDFADMLITEEFLDEYIINVASITIKDLLNKSLSE